MSSHEQLPPAYQASKSSEYRKRMAALARPLPELIQKRLEVGEAIFASTPRPGDWFIDLDACLKAMASIAHKAAASGISMPSSYSSGDELWRRMFYENGVFFDVTRSKLCIGPLIAQQTVGGLEVFFAALKENTIERNALYIPERSPLSNPPRVIVDLSSLLEEAVFNINLIRFAQLEPISSVIFSPAEREKNPTEMLLRQRLKRMVPRGEFDVLDFRRVFDDLREGADDRAAINNAFIGMLIIRFTGLVVRAAHSEDEVEHTLNLCNLLIRPSLICQLAMHHEFERLRQVHGIGSDDYGKMEEFFNNLITHLNFVGWLSDMAYGDPIYRICTLSNFGMVSGGSQSFLYFKEHGMNPVIRRTCAQTPCTSEELFFRVLSCPVEKFRHAAQERLDEVFYDLTGSPFSETHPNLADAFKRINNTTFITPGILPTVAWMWHGSGVNDF